MKKKKATAKGCKTRRLDHASQETRYLLSIPGMRESIQKGLKTPVEEFSTRVEW